MASIRSRGLRCARYKSSPGYLRPGPWGRQAPRVASQAPQARPSCRLSSVQHYDRKSRSMLFFSAFLHPQNSCRTGAAGLRVAIRSSPCKLSTVFCCFARSRSSVYEHFKRFPLGLRLIEIILPLWLDPRPVALYDSFAAFMRAGFPGGSVTSRQKPELIFGQRFVLAASIRPPFQKWVAGFLRAHASSGFIPGTKPRL